MPGGNSVALEAVGLYPSDGIVRVSRKGEQL